MYIDITDINRESGRFVGVCFIRENESRAITSGVNKSCGDSETGEVTPSTCTHFIPRGGDVERRLISDGRREEDVGERKRCGRYK